MTVFAVITVGFTINPKFRGVYKANEVDSEDENTDIRRFHRAELASKVLRLARLLLKKNRDGGEKDYPLNKVETHEGKLEKVNPSRANREHSRDDPFLLDHQANSLVKMPAAFSRRCRYGSSSRCMLPGKRSEVPNAKVGQI